MNSTETIQADFSENLFKPCALNKPECNRNAPAKLKGILSTTINFKKGWRTYGSQVNAPKSEQENTWILSLLLYSSPGIPAAGSLPPMWAWPLSSNTSHAQTYQSFLKVEATLILLFQAATETGVHTGSLGVKPSPPTPLLFPVL